MRKFLERAWGYETFKRAIVSGGQMRRFIGEYIRPTSGARVLDIGCGPADILCYLPESVVYAGFDGNPDYILRAKSIHAGRQATFRCQQIHLATLERPGEWDLVLANGVLHHLDDSEAGILFAIAHAALRPGGRLVTLDGVYEPGQSSVARWLISRDRGQHVRTRREYETLASATFGRMESFLEHELLRLPYTHLILQCTKES